MLKNKKIKLSVITVLIILILLIAGILVVKSGGINKIVGLFQKEEIKKEIRYEIYSLVDNKAKILVTAEDTENGLEKVQYPNNSMELNCNGKNKVAIDYEIDVSQDARYTFVATNSLGEQITNTIDVNDEYRNNELKNVINFTIQKESNTQTGLSINYKENATTKQYKIGETATQWTDYTKPITIDSYQVKETFGNVNNIEIYLRQVDQAGNEIITINTISINSHIFKENDTIITGDSILACVENNTLESGNYIFKVTGTTDGTTNETIEYPVELYNYDEDANYIASSNVKIGNTTYTGLGNATAEKRMLILKYNGNLTIGENVTITPTGTKESINGATGLCTKKGMFIYCANTIENNGMISTTAKGTVNQEGENVYIFRNKDATYEYVPAIGGTGGNQAVQTAYNTRTNGNRGSNGANRQTGGGGSGAARTSDSGDAYSGKGGNGTSYSGGAGGGGVTAYSFDQYGGNASDIGGAGGYGRGSSKTSGSGGAGNPGGTLSSNGNGTGTVGETGTGGLLIIATKSITNNNTIMANGKNGGTESWGGGDGGSSGGGSINIFYKESFKNTNVIKANGGAMRYGGAGGNGSIKINSISSGTAINETEGDGLNSAIETISSSGNYNLKVKGNTTEGTEENLEYLADVIYSNGDLTLDGITQIAGATLSNNVYEFGNASIDVGTATTNATKTVILKVNGNLTIDNNVTLTACKSTSGYGGPKGLIIYCSGIITNNGTISMTARGAKAEGENVYLYQNSDKSFEYIPAIGAIGGKSVSAMESRTVGKKGNDATNRATGGGGSGGAYSSNSTTSSGTGGSGTSYSGGAGGGAGRATYSSGSEAGQPGSSIGGAGGRAGHTWASGGGAGNPQGAGQTSGYNGTGGLLVIYTNTLNNINTISSNGTSGGYGQDGRWRSIRRRKCKYIL